MADGDGRAALTLAEEIWRSAKPGEVFDAEQLQEIIQRRAPIYDKGQEGHYNLISALHKTIRGSDPDAALYYLARMLDAGEDRLFIARRLVRAAVEDIGMADPQALVIANAAKDAFDFLGSPEGELALAQVAVYLATAPKSNAVYTAFKAATRVAKEHGSLMPPKTILNAPTKLMKEIGYGESYRYDHDEPDAFSGQDYWPEKIGPQAFYEPADRGFEREIRKRLDWWAKLRRERRRGEGIDRESYLIVFLGAGIGGALRHRGQCRLRARLRDGVSVGHARRQHRRLLRHGRSSPDGSPSGPARGGASPCGCSWSPACSAASRPSRPSRSTRSLLWERGQDAARRRLCGAPRSSFRRRPGVGLGARPARIHRYLDCRPRGAVLPTRP